MPLHEKALPDCDLRFRVLEDRAERIDDKLERLCLAIVGNGTTKGMKVEIAEIHEALVRLDGVDIRVERLEGSARHRIKLAWLILGLLGAAIVTEIARFFFTLHLRA